MSRLPVSLSVLVLSATSFCCLASDRIIFDRLGPTQATLFVSNADGSAERPLTQPGSLDYNPSWSSNGDWIVFTSERGGSADLYLVHPDGSGLERLTDDPAYDDQAAFSPDGKQLVFVSTRAGGRANLWILDLTTRKATPLTSGLLAADPNLTPPERETLRVLKAGYVFRRDHLRLTIAAQK